jgi:DNA replication regulator DPB11
LQHHILSNDGVVLELLTGSDHLATSNVDRLLIIVPYSHPSSDLPSVEHVQFPPMVITEFWVERCLTSKQFFEPDEHILNRPLPVFPIPGFEKLIVNSTGIADIDLLHLSKVVKVLGAEYDQVLKAGTSVLLCNPSKAGEDKLRHALEWRIPAVSTEWLWSCIRSGKMQPFDAFSVKRGPETQRPHNVVPDPKAAISLRKAESMQTGNSERLARKGRYVELAPPADHVVYRGSLADDGDRHRKSKVPKANMTLGEGLLKGSQRKKNGGESRREKNLAPKGTTGATKDDQREEYAGNDHGEMEIELPLQEVSANSPAKAETVPSVPKARLFRHFDGQSSLTTIDQDDDSPPAPNATSTAKTTYIPPHPESINGAIQDLLRKSRAKHATSVGSNGETRKRRLLGRAVSTISNSSREGSSIRASRASSIDSVNTDGLGSVILDETSQSKRTNSSGQNRRSSFTGRASAHERSLEEPPLEPVDAALYREEYHEDEEPPQMTQLGYDNPEDAVALREMLAERRRNRSRKGQDDGRSSGAKEGKRIKDDAAISATGWGTGRRTRQRMKSP